MKVVVTEVELDIRSTDSLVIVALLTVLIQGMVHLKLEFDPFFFTRRCVNGGAADVFSTR